MYSDPALINVAILIIEHGLLEQIEMCTEKLLSYVERKIAGRQRLLVAFSGGLDSSVLLHLLVRLRDTGKNTLQLRAAYVHHGLSRFADDWMHHCQQYCQQWQVPFTVIRVQLAQRQSGNIEAMARAARYHALGKILLDGEILLTAQHLDDQCETLLLALKRGSGPAGLSSMPECMAFFNSEQLRPLLAIPRAQLEYYALQQHITWVEDDSNQDERFERNFLRHSVIPLLKKRWPQFSQAVARSASLCAEQEQLLDELLQDSLQTLTANDKSICITGLLALNDARRFAILRRWMACCGAMMPGREQLQRLWTEVALCREDGEPQLQLGRWQVRRYRQRLYLLPSMQSLSTCVLPWNINYPLSLPDGLGQLYFSHKGIIVRPPGIDEQVSVRFTVQGKVRIVGRHRARWIKKLWQELAVPPWQRGRIPLLFYGEQLIAAPGVFVTQEGQAQHEGLQLCWARG